MLVIAIDNQEESIDLVKYVKHTYPHIKILARAFDRGHRYLLRSAGADYIESETYHSALETGAEALRSLGYHPFFVEQQKAVYKRAEVQQSDKLYQAWADKSEGDRFDNNYRKLFIELEDNIKQAMARESQYKRSGSERGWTPPPKNYADNESR